MIKVYKLTKRHIEKSDHLPRELSQVKIFSTCTGHGGVGTIDFLECVMQITNEEFEKILKNSENYAKFKLSNILKYGEIEIFKEHAEKMKNDIPDSTFKNLLCDFKEGFLILKRTK